MNGIGIVEWRDTAVASSYPLKGYIGFTSPFVDATFVQFDNFIPILEVITVTASGVTISFTLDDGILSTTIDAVNCIEGYRLKLTRGTRYHGVLVCGAGLSDLYSNQKGGVFGVSTPFLLNTVRSIPSTAGLFSLQGLAGDVSIVTDDAQRLTVASNTITWSAVSKPSRVQQFLLQSTLLYAVTDQKKFVEIDPVTGNYTVLFEVPKAFTTLAVAHGKLYASIDTSLYDMTTVPPTFLMDTPEVLNALTTNFSTGNLVGLTTDSIYVFNSGVTAITSTSNAALTGPSGNSILGITDASTYLVSTPGPYDTVTHSKVADILYIVDTGFLTATLAGMLSIGGDYHQPTMYGAAVIGSNHYTIVADDTNNLVVIIDMTLRTGTIAAISPVDSFVGKFIAITNGGGIRVNFQSVTPLETINGVSPVDNAIQLVGDGLIRIEQTSADELTINLGVDIDNTTIKRSTKYE